MIWSADVSFDGYYQKISEWHKNPDHFIGDPPIDAQYALDLIFKTLIDDKEHYEYLTTVPESTEQINSIMLDLILWKYSKEYRQYLRKKEKTDG